MKEKADMNKRKKKMTVIFIACAVAVVLVGVGVFLLGREYVPYSDTWLKIKDSLGMGEVNEEEFVSEEAVENGESVKTYTPPVQPVSEFENIPVKFYFLERGVECDIYAVGSDNGTMASVPSAKDVSWMSKKGYASPGDIGNAVLAGHNKWKGEQGAFSILGKMKKGEKVAVTFDKGFTRYFEVVSIEKNVKYDDKSVMRKDYDEPILTLVTCSGDWDADMGQSLHRVVVKCKPTTFKGK